MKKIVTIFAIILLNVLTFLEWYLFWQSGKAIEPHRTILGVGILLCAAFDVMLYIDIKSYITWRKINK